MEREAGAGERAARRLDGGGILVRRWLGCWIDFVAAAVLCIAPAIPFAGKNITNGEVIALLLAALGLVIAYFTLTEGLVGRSLGKFVTGTIVVNAAGGRPGVGRALVRTLFRLVEVNPFLLGGLPAGLVLLLTKEKQRLGDLAAGTYVVPVKALASATRTPAVAGVFD